MKKEKRDKKDKGREERLYPICEEQFMEMVLPLREAKYRGKGRPPEVFNIKHFEVCSII
jgi:hypothetical protein